MSRPQSNEIIAVVTGAGSGVGECIATALANAGASVALVGRRMERLQMVQRVIREAGGKAEIFPCDVSRPDDVRELNRRVNERLGTVTVLINGAGVFHEVSPISESTTEKWVQTMNINVAGPYLMCRAFMAGMIQQKWGRIVNISSAAGVVAPGNSSSAYQLSKVALNWFTRQLALELTGTGVTVNAMHPGEVKTEMWAAVKAEAETHGKAGEGMLKWAKMVEQSGGDPPQKSADLVLYLLQPDTDGINGQFLWIRDGIKKPMPTW